MSGSDLAVITGLSDGSGAFRYGTEKTVPHCEQRTFLPRTPSGTRNTERQTRFGHMRVTAIGMQAPLPLERVARAARAARQHLYIDLTGKPLYL